MGRWCVSILSRRRCHSKNDELIKMFDWWENYSDWKLFRVFRVGNSSKLLCVSIYRARAFYMCIKFQDLHSKASRSFSSILKSFDVFTTCEIRIYENKRENPSSTCSESQCLLLLPPPPSRYQQQLHLTEPEHPKKSFTICLTRNKCQKF